MVKLWGEEAWEDYLYWQQQDRKILKRINQLLKDVDRNGYTGIGWVVGDGTFAALSPRLTLTAYRKANVNTGTTVTIWGER